MRLLLTVISLTDGSLGPQILLVSAQLTMLRASRHKYDAASPCQVILQRSENMNQLMTRGEHALPQR